MAKELQIELGISQNTCHQNLKRLVKYGDISYDFNEKKYWIREKEDFNDLESYPIGG